MIPLKDMTPRRSFPIITILLIAVNIAVFIYQLSLSPKALDTFINTYALIPWKMHLALEGVTTR
jgi:rhomboid family protein